MYSNGGEPVRELAGKRRCIVSLVPSAIDEDEEIERGGVLRWEGCGERDLRGGEFDGEGIRAKAACKLGVEVAGRMNR